MRMECFKTVTVNRVKAVFGIQKCAILKMKRKQNNPASENPSKTRHQCTNNPEIVRLYPSDYSSEVHVSPKINALAF